MLVHGNAADSLDENLELSEILAIDSFCLALKSQGRRSLLYIVNALTRKFARDNELHRFHDLQMDELPCCSDWVVQKRRNPQLFLQHGP